MNRLAGFLLLTVLAFALPFGEVSAQEAPAVVPTPFLKEGLPKR